MFMFLFTHSYDHGFRGRGSDDGGCVATRQQSIPGKNIAKNNLLFFFFSKGVNIIEKNGFIPKSIVSRKVSMWAERSVVRNQRVIYK